MSQEGVKLLIKRLSAYQDLISDAYYNGRLIKSEENAKGIELLQQHKVLIPRGDDTYTLHATFRRFLDASLSVQRLYGIGSDIGVAFERLAKLIDALFDAAHEGQLEDRERLEDEILQSIYEISDSLSADLAHLRTRIENHFGDVKTIAEKKRQNAYYIERTEKLVEAIEMFTLSDLSERVQMQGAFVNIAPMFRTQLLDRLPSFRQNLSDILGILKQYLFEYREIEERTRRVRSLWLYLERHPAYELQNWDEEAHPPTWLTKATGLPVRSHPWVRDEQYTDELADIAKSIEPPSISTSPERPRGSLTEEDDPTPTVVLKIKPHQRSIRDLVASCKAQNTHASAIEWYFNHADELGGMNVSVWLQCVLEYLGPRKRKELGIAVDIEELTTPVFTGNFIVNDVWVKPA